MFDENSQGKFYILRKMGYQLLLSLCSSYNIHGQRQKYAHIKRFIRYDQEGLEKMMKKAFSEETQFLKSEIDFLRTILE